MTTPGPQLSVAHFFCTSLDAAARGQAGMPEGVIAMEIALNQGHLTEPAVFE